MSRFQPLALMPAFLQSQDFLFDHGRDPVFCQVNRGRYAQHLRDFIHRPLPERIEIKDLEISS